MKPSGARWHAPSGQSISNGRIEVRLHNKVAVVTGAGHGMGRAYAEGLAREGASVLVTDIDGEAAHTVARDIDGHGGVAVAVRCDIADDAQVQAAADVAVERFGGIDILVNNAALEVAAGLILTP
jgi:3-oxoacyl-[acyl-carrier protein] reductase